MVDEGPLPFEDVSAVREEVMALFREGRIRYNLRYIKSKGHVEVTKQIIDAVLVNGAYQFDKDFRQTRTRFNARGRIAGIAYKVVFEIWMEPTGKRIAVGTAYEVN